MNTIELLEKKGYRGLKEEIKKVSKFSIVEIEEVLGVLYEYSKGKGHHKLGTADISFDDLGHRVQGGMYDCYGRYHGAGIDCVLWEIGIASVLEGASLEFLNKIIEFAESEVSVADSIIETLQFPEIYGKKALNEVLKFAEMFSEKDDAVYGDYYRNRVFKTRHRFEYRSEALVKRNKKIINDYKAKTKEV